MSEIGLFVVAILIALALAVVFGRVVRRISKRYPPLRDDDVEMARWIATRSENSGPHPKK